MDSDDARPLPEPVVEPPSDEACTWGSEGGAGQYRGSPTQTGEGGDASPWPKRRSRGFLRRVAVWRRRRG